MQKPLVIAACAVALALAGVMSASRTAEATTTLADAPCHARVSVVNAIARAEAADLGDSGVAPQPLRWYAPPEEDAATVEQWCRGVGSPVVASIPPDRVSSPPPLEDLVVVTWNAHLSEGRLAELIADLRRGDLTDGTPVEHFVLMLQELYRRGDAVPAFADNARSAYAIRPRDPERPDAVVYARTLGLAMAYVPSMRNGAEMLEDRGNAIISTEPLQDLFAFELPFERQRRVAAGAAIPVATGRGVEPLQVIDVHLEPLAAPSSLWLFRNPRIRQMAALLDLVRQPRFERDSVGTLLAGDFNTVQGGAREEVYHQARAWARSLADEDDRATHMMGRLDYVFPRLAPGWQVDTTRVTNKYGSDHHPVVARFRR